MEPDQRITKVPNNMPICDIANGMASVPAPITGSVRMDIRVAIESLTGIYKIDVTAYP